MRRGAGGDALGSASPSCLVSQIRELLGEDCELDASFLEESWASGLPVTSTSYRRKRNQVTGNDKGVTFAELNTVGSFFFSPADGLMGDRPAYAYRAGFQRLYAPRGCAIHWKSLPADSEIKLRSRIQQDYKRRVMTRETLGSMTLSARL